MIKVVPAQQGDGASLWGVVGGIWLFHDAGPNKCAERVRCILSEFLSNVSQTLATCHELKTNGSTVTKAETMLKKQASTADCLAATLYTYDTW